MLKFQVPRVKLTFESISFTDDSNMINSAMPMQFHIYSLQRVSHSCATSHNASIFRETKCHLVQIRTRIDAVKHAAHFCCVIYWKKYLPSWMFLDSFSTVKNTNASYGAQPVKRKSQARTLATKWTSWMRSPLVAMSRPMSDRDSMTYEANETRLLEWE